MKKLVHCFPVDMLSEPRVRLVFSFGSGLKLLSRVCVIAGGELEARLAPECTAIKFSKP